jgi:hypothetical protein
METKMQEITKQTLQEIETRFKTERGYVLSKENSVYCPQVNGLTSICLAELGFSEEAQSGVRNFLRSPIFDVEAGLFHREVDLEGRIVVPAFNTCKNSVFALALVTNGFNAKAEELMDNLQRSPAYIQEKGLFGREYNPNAGEVNPLLITQSNLWAALAYSSLGKAEKAKQIMKNLESEKYSKDQRLFDSQDCRDRKSEDRFFADDQALAILTYLKIGEEQKARDLAKSVLESPFYDAQTGLFNSSFSGSSVDTTKSTYKNSLMAFALVRLGYSDELKRLQEGLVRDLYDLKEKLFRQSTNDETKIPDNSALALVALEYNHIKHNLF